MPQEVAFDKSLLKVQIECNENYFDSARSVEKREDSEGGESLREKKRFSVGAATAPFKAGLDFA